MTKENKYFKKELRDKNLRKSAKRIEDKLNEHYAKYIIPKFGDIAKRKETKWKKKLKLLKN